MHKRIYSIFKSLITIVTISVLVTTVSGVVKSIADEYDTEDTLIRVSELFGKKLENREGESLGSVKELLIGKNGRIVHIVISREITTMRKLMIPLPWNAVSPDIQKDKIVIDITMDKLKKSPSFDNLHDILNGGNDLNEKILLYFGMPKKIKPIAPGNLRIR